MNRKPPPPPPTSAPPDQTCTSAPPPPLPPAPQPRRRLSSLATFAPGLTVPPLSPPPSCASSTAYLGCTLDLPAPNLSPVCYRNPYIYTSYRPPAHPRTPVESRSHALEAAILHSITVRPWQRGSAPPPTPRAPSEKRQAPTTKAPGGYLHPIQHLPPTPYRSPTLYHRRQSCVCPHHSVDVTASRPNPSSAAARGEPTPDD